MTSEQEQLIRFITPSPEIVAAADLYIQKLWKAQSLPYTIINLASEREFDRMSMFCQLQGWEADQVTTTMRQIERPDKNEAGAAIVAAQLLQQVKEMVHGLAAAGKLTLASPLHVFIKWEACYWMTHIWCHAIRIPLKQTEGITV